MTTLNALQILNAVTTAYNTAAGQSPPKAVAQSEIGTGCVLRVDTYSGPKGTGFMATAVVTFGALPNIDAVVCCLQSGPETTREQNATLVPLLVALLTAEYRQLPAWAQTYFQYEYDAIATRLAAGDVAGALCIAQATSAPEALAPNQAAILALFPS